MNKLILLIAGILLTGMGAFAQKDKEEKEVKKPDATSNSTVDGYVNEAFAHLDTKAGLNEELAKLDEDVKNATLDSTKKADVDVLQTRAKELEGKFNKLSDDVSSTVGKSENATKATVDCGLKSLKCAKAVKTATGALTGLSKGLGSDLKKVTAIKAKLEVYARGIKE